MMVNFYSGFIVPERAAIGARMIAERIARRQADPLPKTKGAPTPSFAQTPSKRSSPPAASTRWSITSNISSAQPASTTSASARTMMA